ncbi:MAG: bile acid:sodium symporter [Spirochaetia bacterium]
MLRHKAYRSLTKNWFLVGLLFSLIAGVLLPGAASLLNPGGRTSTGIVIVLFLIAGFTLPADQIKGGFANFKLHLYVFIFGIIPLYFLLTAPLFKGYLDGYLVYGMYALAVLPTTISTCVVFTQTTGGNTFGALFNSGVANVAGIFLSPLLLSLFLAGSGAALPTDEILTVLFTLTYTMLIPIGIGQALRLRFTESARRVKKRLSEASSALVLLIVFLTISRTASDPGFLGRLPQLGVPFLYLAASHVFLVTLAYFGARIIGLSWEDRICAMYTAPQKTMAMGIPLLTVYFAARPDVLALALFPLLFYHPFQLLTAGVIRGLPAIAARSAHR